MSAPMSLNMGTSDAANALADRVCLLLRDVVEDMLNGTSNPEKALEDLSLAAKRLGVGPAPDLPPTQMGVSMFVLELTSKIEDCVRRRVPLETLLALRSQLQRCMSANATRDLCLTTLMITEQLAPHLVGESPEEWGQHAFALIKGLCGAALIKVNLELSRNRAQPTLYIGAAQTSSKGE
ncbi:MAG: hypothetical protein CL678_00415 [Bdellovibrionaceae bacterium]|nr:hypothetical protein [Pseudobdellovibrionaceae bacterium]